jgi:hypothetical protein
MDIDVNDYFFYYNGGNLAGFKNDPQGGGSSPCEAIVWRQGDGEWHWEPYRELSLFMTVRWGGEYDYVDPDKLELIQTKIKEQAYANMAARNGYCEFCGDVRPWTRDVSRFCSDACETERNELKRAREEQEGIDGNE